MTAVRLDMNLIRHRKRWKAIRIPQLKKILWSKIRGCASLKKAVIKIKEPRWGQGDVCRVFIKSFGFRIKFTIQKRIGMVYCIVAGCGFRGMLKT
ncbi:hypothetical protein TNIN_274491 [Trichonephila inaurata madagascariensis]|uniref:Uncharacterized protein n=1 Tax=Trichonephila inaurata madagascariensis TaxID=2747483 RepID=A0A8X6KAJ8_9ARAC|nr:hypothetical protein TNIN_477251 [Trichonephila inaurata madagascariensis]GFY72660.1 hypothetical protein TNIN_274491 [Trichonephila inaurata madagascariensis]